MHRRSAVWLTAVAIVTAACTPDEAPEPAATVDPDAAAAAGQAAGCEVRHADGDLDGTHLDPADAPPADELYADRPALGGPHFAEWLPAGVIAGPVEERAAVHNLEHGAVAVYRSPDLDDDEADAITQWAEARNDAGLLDERSGAGLLVAPWDGRLDPPVAFRAWGVAADCTRFDEVFADGFVREHFGPAGAAPEGSFGVDPATVVGSSDDTE